MAVMTSRFLNRGEVNAAFSLIGVLLMAGAALMAWDSSRDSQNASEVAARAGRDAARAGRDAQNAVRRLAAEAQARVDETCRNAEGQYSEEVRDLRRVYRFLKGLSAAEIQADPILRYVRQNLGQTEEEVRQLRPGSFCNEPGVGLEEDEPGGNPRFPRRPSGLR